MAAAAIALAALLVGAPRATSPDAQAADLSQFDAGNIIDDAVFWDGYAMTAREVQNFLEAKVPSCTPGYTCLKDYREATRTIPATPMCKQYDAGPYESAADIIVKVAQACGINPRVILVTLQKEQGLVTSRAPLSYAYRSAMGAGCPDTAACDSNYYGFFNQVHYGAYLLKRYTQPPGTGPGTAWDTRFDLRYPVGQWSNILYSPSCSATKRVWIANQATHALYIYTPYTPDDQALAAGYGTGGSCSSYGNRNFFNYYMDWFGSVRGYSVGNAFLSAYTTAGGALGELGVPLTPFTCGLVRGGCFQAFRGGFIMDSDGTDPQVVFAAERQAWAASGAENGYLGYPTTGRICDSAGSCRQEFEGGWVVRSSTTSAVGISTEDRVFWGYYGREFGPLGFPNAERTCTLAQGGCAQQFQHGWIFNTPTLGRLVMMSNVYDVWAAWGREVGILGYPTSSPSDPASGNFTQSFQGGVVTVANGKATLTSVADPWFQARISSPWLGEQTSGQVCSLSGGGCYQSFVGGWLVKSGAGSYALPTSVVNVWLAWGRDVGILGYPVGAPSASPSSGSFTQAFQGGVVTVSGGSGAVTSATDPWFNARLTSPWLGEQTSGQVCSLSGGGCYQSFVGGWLVKSPAGSYALPAVVLDAWTARGRETGPLGYPTGAPSADPSGGTFTQQFQRGRVTVTSGVASVTLIP